MTRRNAQGAQGWAVTATADYLVPRLGLAFLDGTVAGGAAGGEISIGSTPLTTSTIDGLLLRLDGSGGPVWARTLGGNGEDRIEAGAADADRIAVAGTYTAAFDTDGHSLGAPEAAQDILVAMLDEGGTVLWLRQVAGAGAEEVVDVAMDAGGAVWLLLTSPGSVSWSSGQLAGSGLALVRLAGSTGDVIEAERLGGTASEMAWRSGALAAGPDGELYLALTFGGSLTLGDSVVASNGLTDILVARRAESGAYDWINHHGGPDDDGATALTRMADGDIVVVGNFTGQESFGGAELLTPTDYHPEVEGSGADLFVVRYGALDGSTETAVHYGSWLGSPAFSNAVAAVSDTSVVLGGSAGGIDFGHGAIETGAFLVYFSH